jgi:hypothetical protein
VIDPGKVLEIVEAFNRERVEYKVFGGMAVNYLGLNRNTEDADFFVDPAPENVARIKRALRSIWDDPNIDEIQDDDMIGDYPSFQYNPPNADYWIDVVSRLGEAFAYADLPFTVIEVRGVKINVVTPQTLYDMKKDTIRYKDKIDAHNLRDRYDVKD